MPKTKATAVRSSRKRFKELTQAELESLTEQEKKEYATRLARHNNQQQARLAQENASKKVDMRLDLLDIAVPTNVVRTDKGNGAVSSDNIDATFILPVDIMYAREDLRIRYVYVGDLVQVNCHAVPKEKALSVIVHNGEFYVARKEGDGENKYTNLDRNRTDEDNTMYATDDEYVGEIVNIIRKPQVLFENKSEKTEKAEKVEKAEKAEKAEK